MAARSGARNDRLQLRLDAPSKRMLRRAAGHRRITLTRFVLAAALEAAERVLRENEAVTLSAPDWTLLYEALLDPPPPDEALSKLFAERETAGR